MTERAPDPVPMALGEVLLSNADASRPIRRGAVRPDSAQPQLKMVDKITAALLQDANFWGLEAGLRFYEARAVQAIGHEATTAGEPSLPAEMLGFDEARLAARIAINHQADVEG